jgi:hypothetical protein
MELGTWFWLLFSSASGCRTAFTKSDPVPVQNWNWRNINGTGKRFWLLSSSASSCRTSSKNQTRFQIRRLLLTGTDGCNWPNWVPTQHWDELWTTNKSAKHGYCIGILYPSNLVAVNRRHLVHSRIQTQFFVMSRKFSLIFLVQRDTWPLSWC